MRRLPSEWRALAPIMLTSTLVGMTFSLAMPLLSLSLERAGVDSLTIGLNTAGGGFGIFLVAPFVGRLVAALGAVVCFRLSLVGTAACMGFFFFGGGPRVWVSRRL